MKISKRILALVLVLVLTCGTFAYAATPSDIIFQDSSGNTVCFNIETLLNNPDLEAAFLEWLETGTAAGGTIYIGDAVEGKVIEYTEGEGSPSSQLGDTEKEDVSPTLEQVEVLTVVTVAEGKLIVSKPNETGEAEYYEVAPGEEPAPSDYVPEDPGTVDPTPGEVALESAKAAADELNEEDYTVESWAALALALGLAEETEEEMLAKAEAIEAAIEALVLKGSGGEEPDITEAELALAALDEIIADYEAEVELELEDVEAAYAEALTVYNKFNAIEDKSEDLVEFLSGFNASLVKVADIIEELGGEVPVVPEEPDITEAELALAVLDEIIADYEAEVELELEDVEAAYAEALTVYNKFNAIEDKSEELVEFLSEFNTSLAKVADIIEELGGEVPESPSEAKAAAEEALAALADYADETIEITSENAEEVQELVDEAKETVDAYLEFEGTGVEDLDDYGYIEIVQGLIDAILNAETYEVVNISAVSIYVETDDSTLAKADFSIALASNPETKVSVSNATLIPASGEEAAYYSLTLGTALQGNVEYILTITKNDETVFEDTIVYVLEAAISGTITALQGSGAGTLKALAGATVVITDEDAEEVFSGTTDEEGKYIAEDLKYGEYTLNVSAEGYADGEEVDITLSGNVTNADVKLLSKATALYSNSAFAIVDIDGKKVSITANQGASTIAGYLTVQHGGEIAIFKSAGADDIKDFTTKLEEGDKIIATAEDELTSETYTITIIDNTTLADLAVNSVAFASADSVTTAGKVALQGTSTAMYYEVTAPGTAAAGNSGTQATAGTTNDITAAVGSVITIYNGATYTTGSAKKILTVGFDNIKPAAGTVSATAVKGTDPNTAKFFVPALSAALVEYQIGTEADPFGTWITFPAGGVVDNITAVAGDKVFVRTKQTTTLPASYPDGGTELVFAPGALNATITTGTANGTRVTGLVKSAPTNTFAYKVFASSQAQSIGNKGATITVDGGANYTAYTQIGGDIDTSGALLGAHYIVVVEIDANSKLVAWKEAMLTNDTVRIGLDPLAGFTKALPDDSPTDDSLAGKTKLGFTTQAATNMVFVSNTIQANLPADWAVGGSFSTTGFTKLALTPDTTAQSNVNHKFALGVGKYIVVEVTADAKLVRAQVVDVAAADIANLIKVSNLNSKAAGSYQLYDIAGTAVGSDETKAVAATSGVLRVIVASNTTATRITLGDSATVASSTAIYPIQLGIASANVYSLTIPASTLWQYKFAKTQKYTMTVAGTGEHEVMQGSGKIKIYNNEYAIPANSTIASLIANLKATDTFTLDSNGLISEIEKKDTTIGDSTVQLNASECAATVVLKGNATKSLKLVSLAPFSKIVDIKAGKIDISELNTTAAINATVNSSTIVKVNGNQDVTVSAAGVTIEGTNSRTGLITNSGYGTATVIGVTAGGDTSTIQQTGASAVEVKGVTSNSLEVSATTPVTITLKGVNADTGKYYKIKKGAATYGYVNSAGALTSNIGEIALLTGADKTITWTTDGAVTYALVAADAYNHGDVKGRYYKTEDSYATANNLDNGSALTVTAGTITPVKPSGATEILYEFDIKPFITGTGRLGIKGSSKFQYAITTRESGVGNGISSTALKGPFYAWNLKTNTGNTQTNVWECYKDETITVTGNQFVGIFMPSDVHVVYQRSNLSQTFVFDCDNGDFVFLTITTQPET